MAMTWVFTVLAVAVLAHLSGRSSAAGKRSAWQQLCDGLCTILLRALHLAFAIHRSFQAWVHNSLNQAQFDVRELLEDDDTDEIAAKRAKLAGLFESLPQKPEHFAAIIAEEDEPVNSVETLCAWCVMAKVPCLTVYTRNGQSFDDIAYRLGSSKSVLRAANGRAARICLRDGDRIEYIGTDVDTVLATEQQFDIHVSLWSRRNGFPSLVGVARDMCRQAEMGSLTPKDIDEQYVAARLKHPGGFVHPDLVLLYDEPGLQNSEVYQIRAAAKDLDDRVLQSAHGLRTYRAPLGKVSSSSR
ncbi:hypothetical protein DL89DRAFT_269091 [Linderina pennispora]|uniref:ditrans,polycis-polyprenyl diphosphate synthase [(2E,6E)-farnesyldiphosphate specific] n=1 Tax=Linderina pennispora TaxID=61395 RepID=A0A1Y1W359_9FUNG|nr:uncharacterized protein DL89DRAFT_269091 [Linderina pennispora]ORX67907.1 hypothetical protein DL89DRAFT_269091 [Linderina pennispora]